MVLTNGLVVIFAAIGAVIFLFLMDYYYRVSEPEANPTPIAEEEVATKTDEPNVAA